MQLERASLKTGVLVPMVAVLSNPLSTTNSLGMNKIREITSNAPNVVHFELNGIESIDEALALFARANPSLLVINGGDGTVGAVLAALLYRNPFAVIPPIAVMPGGKTNMTAADLGYKGDPEKVLKGLLKAANEGRISDKLTLRNLIELDMNDGTAPRVGTFFGAAGIVKAIKWTRQNAYAKGIPNRLAHVMAFLTIAAAFIGLGPQKKIARSSPMEMNISGGGRMHGEYAIILATTLDTLVMGLKPYGFDGQGGLRFSAVESGAANMWRSVRALFSGKWQKGSVDGLHVRRSNEITIEGGEPVTLDGEMFTPKPGVPMTLRGDKQLTFVRV